MTVAEYITGWLGPMPKAGEPTPAPPTGLTPKTAERYRELAEAYIYPHLGGVVLQKLKPAKVREWHETLLKSGGAEGPAAGGPHRGPRPSRPAPGAGAGRRGARPSPATSPR